MTTQKYVLNQDVTTLTDSLPTEAEATYSTLKEAKGVLLEEAMSYYQKGDMEGHKATLMHLSSIEGHQNKLVSQITGLSSTTDQTH